VEGGEDVDYPILPSGDRKAINGQGRQGSGNEAGKTRRKDALPEHESKTSPQYRGQTLWN